MIDEYLVGLNQENHDEKIWRDKGINTALEYTEAGKKKMGDERREYDERLLQMQRPIRSRF
jgi:hypothetical protein